MRKLLLPVAAVAAAALGIAACDQPRTHHSAYINSGASATPAMPATSTPSESPAETIPQPLSSYPPADPAVSQAPAVSDTTSPSTASAPQGEAAPAAR